MVTGANSWRGAMASRIPGSCGQHGEQGPNQGVPIPSDHQSTLDADGRGAQGKHPRLVALVVPQEMTSLTIILSDFLALYN